MIKNLKKNAFLLVAITFIVLFFVMKDDFANIVSALLKINFWWFLIALLCYGLYLIFKSLALRLTVREEKKDYTLMEAVKHNMITQFFNGVTPFSTGGQPMEVYMLKEKGIRYATGTNIIIQNFVFYQTALVLFGILAVGLNYIFHIFEKVTLLQQLILIGFLINTVVAVALFLIMFAKKLNVFLIQKGIHLLSKMKIIKDSETAEAKWLNRLETFHQSASHLKENKWLFFQGVFYQGISLAFYYIIPLFLAFSMHNYTSLNPMTAIVASAYVLIIGAFVPIPGASGGIEYGFLAFFGTFISGSTLPAMLLIWRFITYYLGMIVGAVIFSFDKGGKKQ